MARIAILDHATHTLIVEDIDEKKLNETYHGSEQEYIDKNYVFEGDYSWDYIVSADYFGEVSPDPYDLGENIDKMREWDLMCKY